MALAWLDPWRRVARKPKAHDPWPHPARVAVVEPSPLGLAAWQDALAPELPQLECLALGGLDELSGMMLSQALDLAIVRPEAPEALTWWLRRHARRKPWLPLVVLAPPDLGLGEAWGRYPTLQGIVDPSAPDAPAALGEAAVAALRWRSQQAQKGEALAMEAAQAAEAGQWVAAASAYLAAYELGFLEEPDAQAMEKGVQAALPSLATRPALLGAAHRALCARAADRLDEALLIRRARALEQALPERAAEAKTWLGQARELEGWTLAALEVQLDATLTWRRLGRHDLALEAAEGVLARQGNLLVAHQWRAEALQALGQAPAAAEAALAMAGLSAKGGEIERARLALDWAKALGPTAPILARIQALDAELEAWEQALAQGAPGPRRPTLQACPRALCQEAAELSGLLVRPLGSPGDPECDLCGAEARPLPALRGRCLLVVGDRLGLATVRALEALGARRVLLADGHRQPELIPELVAEADAVILVMGTAREVGHVKAERSLQRHPRPTVRVAFPGLRQIARAVRLGLLPQLEAL